MNPPTNNRTVQLSDLFRLTTLFDAHLSPDSTHVVYTVVTISQETNEEHLSLWLLSLESNTARPLTGGLRQDSSPRWSPDGKHIAFISTRNAKPQIYLIPVDGGEARALTALKQGVGSGLSWSPDAKQIAFTASPPVEPLDPAAPYRVTRHIYRFDNVGYVAQAVQDILILSIEGGEPRRLTDDGCMNTAPRWSPDGQEILYTVSLRPDSHRVLPGLRIVNLDGQTRDLVWDWGYIAHAAWTPDGRKVVFTGAPHGLPISSKTDLWVIDRQGGTPQCRSGSFTVGIGGNMLQSDMPRGFQLTDDQRILVTPDSRFAYAQVLEGGNIRIYRVTLDEDESCSSVVVGDRSCIPQAMNNNHLLYVVSKLDNPTDLFISDLNGANERQLTRLNADWLSDVDLPVVEHLAFSGQDGTSVEGWILKPTVGEPPYPTVLYIHGGPASGFGNIFSFDFQMLAGAGYAVLLVNHRGSTGYGSEFSTKIIGDWGNHDYHDLMAGVDAAIAKGLADSDRLGVCGLSGGGNLTCWIVGQTDRFKAAVPENPVTNWVSMYGVSDIGPWFVPEYLGGLPHEIPEVYRRCSPITYAHRCKTPTLLIQGEHDWRCPPEQSEQFYGVLKANGCIVEMLRFPASPHAGAIQGPVIFRRAQNEALLDWMNRFVLNSAATPASV